MDKLKLQTERWISRRPFIGSVAAIPQAIRNVSSGVSGGKKLTLDSIKEEFAKGEPLIYLTDIVDMEKAGVLLIKLTTLYADNSLPQPFAKVCEDLHKKLNGDKSLAADIVASVVGLADESRCVATSAKLKEMGVDSPLLTVFAWAALAGVLSPYMDEIALWQEANNWLHGYCPTCGSEPVMAQLKKTSKGRRRFLVCDHCKTRWSYKRIGCPYCGDDEQEHFGLLELPDEDDVRVDVCNSCDSYIKTAISEDFDLIAIQDWASVHIDILCNGTKYKKHGNLLIME